MTVLKSKQSSSLSLLLRCIIVLCLTTGMVPLTSQAADKTGSDTATDKTPEKIHISANSMNMNVDTGNSIYSGDVKITQGQLVLTGDTVTIVQIENQIDKIIVVGKPASYTHVTQSGEAVHATSKRMVYIESKSRLTLTGDAVLEQPAHTVKSQKIVYDTKLRTVAAGKKPPTGKKGASNQQNTGRVNITLTPNTDHRNEDSGNKEKNE